MALWRTDVGPHLSVVLSSTVNHFVAVIIGHGIVLIHMMLIGEKKEIPIKGNLLCSKPHYASRRTDFPPIHTRSEKDLRISSRDTWGHL